MNFEIDISNLYYTEKEVATFLNKTTLSLRCDASRRKGPPRTKIGRKILYKKSSFESWLLKKESDFDILRHS